ncbi:MAG: hypothetical protein LQ343_002792 [Gyalolechia ehrenbergii]|nr:MAG: hypothetical protein LQ343_002792 [Gyalolechia ehrenbergii]
MSRRPHASTQVLFGFPDTPTVNQKLEYISFHFQKDGEPADVAWTFAIAEGEDLIESLKNYALSMGKDPSDEYVGALQSYIGYLYAQNLLLEQPKTIKQSAGSETDVKTHQKSARGKPKESVPAILLPGREREEEIELRLRQGQSFLDLASTLHRSRSFIYREAKRLLGEHGLKTLMKQNKKGQWSELEMQYLTLLRQQKLSLREITMWLRRTRPSVEKNLRELGTTIFEPTAVEGPQEMPLGFQESLFNTRLADVWHGLLQSDMTEKWRKALQRKPTEEWLSTFSAGIPGNVKRLLGGLRPPTWGELEALPSTYTDDAGVYARLVSSRYEIQTGSDRYLYIGSASRYGGGLNIRISEHTVWRNRSNESRLQRDIRKKGLKGNDRFVTLMVMKMDSPKKENVLDVRLTVTLAEAILTMWLGALQPSSLQLQNLCPWDPQTLEYTGWSSHNPLTVDAVEPSRTEDSNFETHCE